MLENEKAMISERTSQLQIQLDESTTLIASLTDGVNDLKRTVEQRDLAIADFNSKVQTLMMQNEELIRSNEGLIRESEQRYLADTTIKDNGELQIELQQKNILIEKLNQNIELSGIFKKELENIIGDMELTNNQLLSERDSFQEQVKVKEAIVVQLQQELSTEHDNLEKLQGHFKQSQQRVQELIVELDTIQATLGLKEADIQSLESSLTSANELSSALQSQVNKLKTELEQTISQLNAEMAQTQVRVDL